MIIELDDGEFFKYKTSLAELRNACVQRNTHTPSSRSHINWTIGSVAGAGVSTEVEQACLTLGMAGRYFLGYDLIMKNLEKIKNPRPHNHVIAMM